MSEISEIATSAGGNTITPARKKSNQLKNWFFTFNNYNETDIEILKEKFNELCESYCFQQEIGENGTPHLQGIITLYKRARWSEFNLPKEIHWEKPMDVKDCYKYCSKLETRKLGTSPITKNYTIPKELKCITILRPWQEKILNLTKGEPDGRSIYWFWENKGGVGKSSFCKYMVIKHNVLCIQGGKLADIMNIIFNTNMDEVNTVIIDIPRNNGNKVSYNSIECILNGMITNTKFETGVKLFNPPHVIVFSNQAPETEKLSEDRWVISEIFNNDVDLTKY